MHSSDKHRGRRRGKESPGRPFACVYRLAFSNQKSSGARCVPYFGGRWLLNRPPRRARRATIFIGASLVSLSVLFKDPSSVLAASLPENGRRSRWSRTDPSNGRLRQQDERNFRKHRERERETVKETLDPHSSAIRVTKQKIEMT